MKPTALVIGGGPAGCTAALRLSATGVGVTLIERSDRLGGCGIRQPMLLFGAAPPTCALGILPGYARRINSLTDLPIEFLFPGSRRARLRHPWAPGPLHTLLALSLFRGLALGDRWRALNLIERTWEADPALPSDLDNRTADTWLAERGQSAQARRQVWDPLARVTLGDRLVEVSAATFVRMVSRHFLSTRNASRVRLLDRTTQDALIEEATEELHRSQAAIRLKTEAVHLHFEADRIASVELRGGDRLTADWYIAAVPHRTLCGLLPDRALAHYAYFEHLTKLADSPCVRVDLWFDRPMRTSRLVLLADQTYNWMVSSNDGSGEGKGAAVSLVMTGNAPGLECSDQTLLRSAQATLDDAIPSLRGTRIKDYEIARDPAAVLSLRPGTQSLRPIPQSPAPNLLVAGSWTDTSLPDTIESAIVSAVRCAEIITGKVLCSPTPGRKITSEARRTFR